MDGESRAGHDITTRTGKKKFLRQAKCPQNIKGNSLPSHNKTHCQISVSTPLKL